MRCCLNISGGRKYASVLLLSDAKLDIDRVGNTPKTTEEYKKLWKERLFGADAPVEVEQVFAQNYLYNGYEMSGGEHKIVSEMLTEAGSSIKISYADSNESALEYLAAVQDKGIGRDTNLGYGKVQICGKIHQIGIRG